MYISMYIDTLLHLKFPTFCVGNCSWVLILFLAFYSIRLFVLISTTPVLSVLYVSCLGHLDRYSTVRCSSPMTTNYSAQQVVVYEIWRKIIHHHVTWRCTWRRTYTTNRWLTGQCCLYMYSLREQVGWCVSPYIVQHEDHIFITLDIHFDAMYLFGSKHSACIDGD